jgi:spore germination protein YaaH
MAGAPPVPVSVAALGVAGPGEAIAPGWRAATARRPAPASQPQAAPALEPSAQYRASLAHGGSVPDFAPGARVTTPFVPRAGDDWDVDGAPPQGLPAGAATGATMRAAPAASEGIESATGATVPRAPDRPQLAAALNPPVAGAPLSAPVGGAGLRRDVFGFLPWWELSSASTVLDWRSLSTVAYFSVGCQGNGNLLKRNPDGSLSAGWAGWTSARMTAVIQAAHQHQTRVVLTVSCFAWSADGAATQAALLASSSARARLARQIAAAVRDRGADGVNLDFEPLVAGSADLFTSLVRQVRSELNAVARGYQLTFDALGSIGNQPIAAATAPGAADAVLVMAYDYRTADASAAGSISPLTGPAYDLTDTIRAFTAVVPPSKVILGVPWYGRAWSTPNDAPHARNMSGSTYGTVAEPTYSDAAPLLRAYGRRWDPVEQSPWTAYRKRICRRAGCITTWRELYVDDAASLGLRYDLVNRAGLRGVGIWALGFDGSRPELRRGLAAKFLADRTPPVAGIVTLAPRQRDEGFRVAWTSYDDSAIRGYDVQVSVDGGAWEDWLTGVTNTSAIFPGSNGHLYAFRVRAGDVHGNVSSWQSLSPGSLTTPASISVGGFATVLTNGLRLRAAPSTGADVMTLLGAGDALQVVGGPRIAGGYTWFQVVGPVRQWSLVDAVQVGGWVAAFGNGYRNVAPRGHVSATLVDAGIVGLQLNGGGARVLTPDGDRANDTLRIAWTNRRDFDRLSLRVYRANGTFLGSLSLGAGRRSAGPHAFAWDGRLEGRRVPSGAYVIQLQGTAGGTTASAPSAAPVNAFQLARWGVVLGRADPTSIAATSIAPASPTRSGAITYSLTFGGSIGDLNAADFTRTGTARGCRLGQPTGSGASWKLTVSGCGAGTLLVSLRSGSVVDAVANRGPAQRVSLPAVLIDRTAPAATAPRATLRTGVSLPGASSPSVLATLDWSAHDGGGAGLASYDVRASRDGGAFADLASATATASLALMLAPGHAYRFEVRARDRAGNVGGWVAGATIRPALVQEGSSTLKFAGQWLAGADSRYSGGSLRSSVASGATLSTTFTGRAIAWVSTLGADRGAARVYVDGVLVATVNTQASQIGMRAVVWSRAWARTGTHTIRIVVAATPGHPRVDVDAFEILR